MFACTPHKAWRSQVPDPLSGGHPSQAEMSASFRICPKHASVPALVFTVLPNGAPSPVFPLTSTSLQGPESKVATYVTATHSPGPT